MNCGVDDILEFVPERKKEMDLIPKGTERDELHRAIWAIADELREQSMADFKTMFLAMFYRYISKTCKYINNGEIDAGNTELIFKNADEDAEEAGDW